MRIAQALALATSVREGMPELHCEQVSELSAAIARELGLPPAMVFRCRLGGLLHDVGKVAIPDAHPGQARPARRRRVARRWSATPRSASSSSPGCPACARPRPRCATTTSAGTAPAIPTGWPREDIPLEARIVAVADAYSAITSDRVYQRGREQSEALRELRRTAGAHHDAEMVEALARVLQVDARAVQARMRALGGGAEPQPERWHRTRRAS